MPHKKSLFTLIIIAIFVLLTACSATQSPTQTATESPQSTTALIADQRDTNMVEKVSESMDIPISAFCQVNFSVDSANSVSVDYAPKFESKLELIDDSGATWQLIIPAYSLNQPVTLRMTALNGIKSDDVPAQFNGGVLLEPDGLVFLTPVQLNRLNSQTENPVLLTGSNQGENMSLILESASGTGFSIEHFSSIVATDRGSLRQQRSFSELEKKVLENERQILAMAQQYLKDHAGSIETPPPPALSMACEDAKEQTSSGEKLEKFIEDAYEPEGLLIRQLLKAQYEKEVLGIQTINNTENQRLVDKLLFRLEKKALYLMETYSGKADYLLAVSNFGLKIAKDIELFGSKEEFPETRLKDEMGDWIARSLDDVIKKVKEEHDFRQIDVAVKVAKWAGILGTDITDKLWSEIGKAMTFELKLFVLYKGDDTEYFIEAITPIQYRDLSFPLVLAGVSQPTFTFSTSLPDVTVTADPYPLNITITDFDPCQGKGVLTLDKFYASGESMTIEDETYPQNLTLRWWEFCYGDYKSSGIEGESLYTFPFTINNLNPTVASEMIEGKNNSKGQMLVEFHIQLTHKPKE